MKQLFGKGLPEFFGSLVSGRNSPLSLCFCFVFAITSGMANRWLYQMCPDASLAFKIPLGVLVSAGGLAGVYAFCVLSYRFNRRKHAAFGFIVLAVLLVADRFIMQNLIRAGFEPDSGPPFFGALLACITFGYFAGFLLAGISRNEPER